MLRLERVIAGFLATLLCTSFAPCVRACAPGLGIRDWRMAEGARAYSAFVTRVRYVHVDIRGLYLPVYSLHECMVDALSGMGISFGW